MRKASVLFVFLITLFSRTYSQTTTNCLDVESILVNACGPIEGYNEMVRVLVGPNPLTVNSISGSWPNFAFDPWVMNSTTASKTAGLNATITTCGYLLEPLSGTIPANKKFIIVPSYLIDVSQNTFDGLTDTLYIIYQNSVDPAGRFANSGTGVRILTVTYPGCVNEVVSYSPANIQNVDGARVNFDIAGNPTYTTGGCTAPVSQFAVDAGADQSLNICPGGTINLSGTVIGTSTFVQWSGGNGTFSTPNSLTTNYTLPVNATGSFWLYLRVKGACPDTLKDSLQVTIQAQNPLQIMANGPLSICNGNSLTLTASGGGTSYQWNGGPATAQYTINAPGTYTVQSSDACYNYQQSITVSTANAPSVSIAQANSILCPDSSLTATATSTETVSWNTGASGGSITITSGGTYIATVSNGCGTSSDTLIITAGTAPSAIINSPNPTSFCQGTDVQLVGSGSGTLTWSNGTTGNTTTVNQAGQYTLIAQNACGADTATVTVNEIPIQANFTADPTTGYAPLSVNFTNNSTGADTYAWDFGNGSTSSNENSSQVFTNPGTYNVVLAIANAQGCVDTISVQITVANQMVVELPNIFTPNGDLANDVYLIKALGVQSMRGEIFNRWGQKMFTWEDPNIGWDGKSMFGSTASPGVYFCVVEATDSLGEKHTFKTTITLIN